MTQPPGKVVADEFYVHLAALSQVQNEQVIAALQRLNGTLPQFEGLQPNVAKVNLRTGRLSLLAYPGFFEEPFPGLAATWVYPPGKCEPAMFRRYDETLNPPVLHRKELLVGDTHPAYARWAATTTTAESLGLFEDTSTIGFRLNWDRLVEEKGYRLVGEQFLPLGNHLGAGEGDRALSDPTLPVQRHLTALVRSSLSAPVQLLIRQGVLAPGQTFFDYGCGRGGDIAGLRAEGYEATGWDPHYLPHAAVVEADIVNLGFVINVIEDPAERVEALSAAFRLARSALAVGVMLYGADTPGRPYRDGFLTSRNTFQKYFTQAELKDYVEQVLHRQPLMAGPGVAFVFADSDAEQRYCVGRYRCHGLATRLLASRRRKVRVVQEPTTERVRASAKPPKPPRAHQVPRPSAAEAKLADARPYLDRLWAQALDLGRFPDPDEVLELERVRGHVGTLARAQRLLTLHYDTSLLQKAATTRADDLRLYMATRQFSKQPSYRQLEPRLQRDIKAFFGDYKAAQESGLRLLVEAADPAQILAGCKEAAACGYGWLDGEHSLQLHLSLVERLSPVLRAYVACGLILWDSLTDVQLVKIHVSSGKLTLLEYDSFDESPLPLLRRRIKVHVRRLNYEVFEYGTPAHPKPVLYHKSRYLNEDYPSYAEQLAFDESLERFGLIADGEGPPAAVLSSLLDARRLAVSGLSLARSETLPDLDARCGVNFTYRELIECGQTQKQLGIANLPLRPETYNALYDLAVHILDPLIEYFGAIRLTYGFASPALTRKIKQAIAPKLDQHAACERSARGALICERGGAACDFLVEDENMREVADWINSHLPFDRLYYYGPDRPIHVSYAPIPARAAYQMVPVKGRLIPRAFGGDAAT